MIESWKTKIIRQCLRIEFKYLCIDVLITQWLWALRKYGLLQVKVLTLSCNTLAFLGELVYILKWVTGIPKPREQKNALPKQTLGNFHSILVFSSDRSQVASQQWGPLTYDIIANFIRLILFDNHSADDIFCFVTESWSIQTAVCRLVDATHHSISKSNPQCLSCHALS